MRVAALLIIAALSLSACANHQVVPASSAFSQEAQLYAAASVAGHFTGEYPISRITFEVLRGGDGNIWFPEGNGTRNGGFGRLTPGGVLTEWAMPLAGLTRFATLAPDGNIWFCLAYTQSGGYLGSITPAGSITLHPLPTTGPRFVTVGPDGNLWYTDDNNMIGRYSFDGSVTTFEVPTSNSGLRGITTGPDGNLWFIESAANQIGRLTTSGNFTEYSVPSAGGSLSVIDGKMWFIPNSGNYFGRISTGGHYSQVAVPGYPGGVTKGSNGRLWFSLQDTNAIGSMTANGKRIQTYAVPTPNVNPVGGAFGSDGRFYFTEPLATQPAIGVFQP